MVIIVVAIVNIIILNSFVPIIAIAEDSRRIVGRYQGNFDSEFHSDGFMDFDLYSDGTLIGNWTTENKTVTLNITGHYIIKNSEIVMTASGSSLLRSATEAKVIVFAYGKFSDRKCGGVFQIYIDHPQFPNDNGTWKAYKN